MAMQSDREKLRRFRQRAKECRAHAAARKGMIQAAESYEMMAVELAVKVGRSSAQLKLRHGPDLRMDCSLLIRRRTVFNSIQTPSSLEPQASVDGAATVAFQIRAREGVL